MTFKHNPGCSCCEELCECASCTGSILATLSAALTWPNENLKNPAGFCASFGCNLSANDGSYPVCCGPYVAFGVTLYTRRCTWGPTIPCNNPSLSCDFGAGGNGIAFALTEDTVTGDWHLEGAVMLNDGLVVWDTRGGGSVNLGSGTPNCNDLLNAGTITLSDNSACVHGNISMVVT
jgi:hypothetical protein